jgi:hypothetical protein
VVPPAATLRASRFELAKLRVKLVVKPPEIQQAAIALI